MVLKIEDAIQRDLILWLNREYPHVKVIATRNEENRYRTEEIDNGLPDLILRVPVGVVMHFVYFEVKTRKGRLSPDQKKWAERPRLSNEHYGVGYGLEDCKAQITLHLSLSTHS